MSKLSLSNSALKRIASANKRGPATKKAQMTAESLSGPEAAIYQLLMESGLVSSVEDAQGIRWDVLSRALSTEAANAESPQEADPEGRPWNWDEINAESPQEADPEGRPWNWEELGN